MQVRCKTNNVNKLSNLAVRDRLRESIRLEEADTDLIVGKTYPVLAIDKWQDEGIRIYLHTVEESDHPYPYPVEMFEVIDQSIPEGWCIRFEYQQSGLTIKRISFPEWANGGDFYERLVDGDAAAIATYRQQRSILLKRKPDAIQ